MSDLEKEISPSGSVQELRDAAHHNALVTEVMDKQITKWEAMKRHPYACFCILTMVWVLISTSFESQAGGTVISIGVFREDFGHLVDGSYVLRSTDQSILSGVPLATQIVGQWLGSWLADKFGKKWVIYGGMLTSCAFVGMEFAATTMGVFIAGKTLNGFSLGVIQASCVSYVADISPLPLRGLSTALCNISFSIGPLVVFIINYCVANFKTRWAYRAMLSSQWGFAAVSLVLMLLIPESPTYYILQGKVDKAEQAYRRLLGDPVAAVNQVTVVKETVLEAEKISEGSTYLDCFKGVNLKRTMVSCVPFMSTSFSGVAFTGSYTTYFFQLSGLDEQKSFQYTCGAQAISIGGCIASLFIVDRFGRRNNLIYGLLSICLCDLIIGATATASDSKPEVLNVCIGFMMLYGGIYNAGLGSVCYPICAENPTSALRTKTVALGLASGNLFSMMWSFVIPYVFNPDQANLGGKTMFIFFGISVLIWVHIFFFQTETAGRSYDEIDEMYASGIPLRKFQHYTSKLANIDVGLTEEEKAVQVKHVEEL
ncbi:hypothetical protein PSN45_004864 [Yamadazyma tenuis]|uniref:Major facilitator superfamily (MFS) profile domain-containing protein n=2 Tax=Candida tenuis (strain ATCC 10573 / BCRC 21748 / CBS 615 / JCM 9827 / NBRC 10315 / NRRL Y-1498 / VKM Y-70) TaxID=590646 RepID=G3B1X2_CANTC|nr:uncharacterized protein CANTEDRAFT_120163 [Yamadazyma tenuis ATCC 10573]EGV64550.1 hypothetical protein CANTEDRAFT_120163 [Yamadazyma tenuis ATCC 10573]WEJ97314.1 hypothetical protein PSN45_004864 [Yamadazyma tenuis]